MLKIKNKQSLKEFKFILIAFIKSIFAPTLRYLCSDPVAISCYLYFGY